MSRIFECLLTFADISVLWGVPALEEVDQAFPFSLRLLIGVALILGLAWSRQRQDER